jgi:hypothetical protein
MTALDVWPEDDDPRWAAAVGAFAEHHAADPRRITRDGATTTVSLDYHARVSRWVRRLDGAAPHAARLAALAQHVRRFEMPRSDYPEGPQGYKRWRVAAGLRHAAIASQIVADVGYPAALAKSVGDAILKKGLGRDEASALLEDAVCLRFVEDELATFAAGRDAVQLRSIVAKTVEKMSDRGRARLPELLAVLPAPLVAALGDG